MSESNHIEKATVLEILQRPDCSVSFDGKFMYSRVGDLRIITGFVNKEDTRVQTLYPEVKVEHTTYLGDITYTHSVTFFSGNYDQVGALIPVSFVSIIDIGTDQEGRIMRLYMEGIIDSNAPVKVSLQVENEQGNDKDTLDVASKDSSSWSRVLYNDDIVDIQLNTNKVGKPFVDVSLSRAKETDGIVVPALCLRINNQKIHAIYFPDFLKFNPDFDTDLRNGKLEPLVNPPTVFTFTGQI
jgi:hypothetical protein